MHQLSISEQLTYSTARIECLLKDGNTSTGTAFFFQFVLGGGNIPVIATNKHVVADSASGRFFLHRANSDGAPEPTLNVEVMLDNFEQRWDSPS